MSSKTTDATAAAKTAVKDKMVYSIQLDNRIKECRKSMTGVETQISECKARVDRAKAEENADLLRIYEGELSALKESHTQVAGNLAQLNVLKSQVASHASETDLMDSVETLIVLSTPVQQNNPTLLKRFAQYQKQRAEADRLRNSVASGITKSDGKTQERVSRMQEEQSQKVADFLAVTTFGSVVVKEEKEKDIQQQ